MAAIPMVADTGPIGGDLSHEFIILAPTGESQVFYDAAFEGIDYGGDNFDAGKPDDLERFFTLMTTQYARHRGHARPGGLGEGGPRPTP